ncbi:hypothetical protein [Paenibacillus tepidiphilus]|uniref:hypothetical protein n=1 Tax=Paenibacillus tepidiphilus TaxID=2608683 RepID=UPI00123ACC12|nr:hypothetical protein [Paenibacillus tepidiphilus]
MLALSFRFVNDLVTGFPESHDRLSEAMRQREQQVLSFYEEGIRREIFNPVNGRILIMQD